MASQMPSVALQPAEKSTRAVLVIADTEMNWMLFDYLVAKDWSIEYAASNRLALESIRKKKFDLVITADVTSASEDLKLLRQIRSVHPHTRMILMTNQGTTSDVIEALRLGAFSLFSKPYSFETLSQMIHMALEEPCWDDGIEVLSATPAWIRLLVRCDAGTAERMAQYFHEIVDLPALEAAQIGAAFREMLLNAIGHGAGFDPDQYVEIRYVKTRHAVACRIKDPGRGFSLDELYKVAVSDPIDDSDQAKGRWPVVSQPWGSYGILLARHLVDDLIFNEQGNEVLLVKYLNMPSAAPRAL